MQASNAFASAGAAAPDEFYDLYAMDLEAEGPWARARRRFFRHRLAVVSLFILVVVAAAGFLSSHIAQYGYEEVNINALSAPPSWAHPFGTDQVGRDYFSRTLYGLRSEVSIALLIGFFGTLVGTLVGAAAGYLGRFTDLVVMRVADLFLTVPPLVTVLVAAAFFHTDTLFEVCLLLGLLLWMPVARVVRSSALVLREQEYVQAARALGASDLRILRRHILPNAVGSVAVAASVMTASAVILETTLSYLGLGLGNNFYGGRTDTKLPSVGDVLAAASNEGLFNWWGIVFPGIAIILLVAPIYFVGDGIRDALDPTQRRYVSERELARRRRGPSRLTRLARTIPRPQVSVRLRMPARALAVIDALPRRRRIARGRLLLEVVAVLALTAGVSAAVYVWKVNPVESDWALGSTSVQNVSRAQGVQTQLALAADPSRTGALFGASNDTALRTIRVYTSADAGRTWTTTPGPPLPVDTCQRGDVSATVDPQGRQFVAFTVGGCTRYEQAPYVVAAVRASASAPWVMRRLGPQRPSDFWDDYPSIVAGGGRVYVVWGRLLRWTNEGVVVSSSADGGMTWTKPRIITAGLSYPRLPKATVAPDGTLYVTGIDATRGVWVARSADAGRTFDLRQVAPLPGNRAAECATSGDHPTPYQGIRCVGPNPSVAASARRVYVTYGVGGPGEPQSVHVASLDRSLRRLSNVALGPATNADRFWPASSVEAASGRLRVCFYDTSGDKSRANAWYSCTQTRDGRTWATPVRAAVEPSSPEVLWEDARVYAFGDEIGYGGYTAVATSGGKAHALWIDTRNLGGRKQEVFGATLR